MLASLQASALQSHILQSRQLKRKLSDSQVNFLVEFIFTISGLKAGIRNYRSEPGIPAGMPI